MYCSTFDGMNKWFVHVFEKFGWMLLARARMIDETVSTSDRTDAGQKVKTYSNELKHLMKSLSEASYADTDKMKDIECMKHKLQILMNHFNEDFKSIENMSGGTKKKSSKKTSKKSTKTKKH